MHSYGLTDSKAKRIPTSEVSHGEQTWKIIEHENKSIKVAKEHEFKRWLERAATFASAHDHKRHGARPKPHAPRRYSESVNAIEPNEHVA